MDHTQLQLASWPPWRKITFRFFFILFFLQIAPVYWPALDIPPFSTINDAYAAAIDRMVTQANAAVPLWLVLSPTKSPTVPFPTFRSVTTHDRKNGCNSLS